MTFFQMRPPKWFYLLFLIGFIALVIRALLDSKFANSTLLYIAVPYGISVFLHHFIGHIKETSRFRAYLNHMRDAIVVMLASSALLFEGFICVLMFLPIYFITITITYLGYAWRDRNAKKGSQLGAYILPALVFFVCLEGLHHTTTFQRTNEVTYSTVVSGDIATLKNNLAQPITFQIPNNWLLSLFSWPVRVQAGSLNPGDVHTVDFVYKRWFFTNTHTGSLDLQIKSVASRSVETKVVKNTSYLASYLNLKGTRISFTPISKDKTGVSLTVFYDRLLDPAWYFGPLQQFAIQKTAKHLIETIVVRDGPHGER